MIYTAREDIEAPIDFVFAQLTDFPAMERLALRRGIEVTRADTAGASGLRWFARFPFRGKTRDATIEIVSQDQPSHLAVHGQSPSYKVDGQFDLLQLSPRRTRLQLSIDIRARTVAARLMIQSMKLARGKIARRLAGRLHDYALEIEGRYRNRDA